MKLIRPVMAKLQRQPNFSSRMPMIGTPIADANLAAESKMDDARLRSRAGNQRPMALALAGKVGASPTPNSSRAAKNPPSPGVIAEQNDATLHKKVLIRPMRRMPNLSKSTPIGNWHMAYVQLYA